MAQTKGPLLKAAFKWVPRWRGLASAGEESAQELSRRAQDPQAFVLSESYHRHKRTSLAFSVLSLLTFMPGLHIGTSFGLLDPSHLDVSVLRLIVWLGSFYYAFAYLLDWWEQKAVHSDALSGRRLKDFEAELARLAGGLRSSSSATSRWIESAAQWDGDKIIGSIKYLEQLSTAGGLLDSVEKGLNDGPNREKISQLAKSIFEKWVPKPSEPAPVEIENMYLRMSEEFSDIVRNKYREAFWEALENVGKATSHVQGVLRTLEKELGEQISEVQSFQRGLGSTRRGIYGARWISFYIWDFSVVTAVFACATFMAWSPPLRGWVNHHLVVLALPMR